MTDLTKPMRKRPTKFSDITPETRKQIFDLYLNSADNSYRAIGEKFGLTYSMVGTVVEVELGEYRKKKTP